MDKQTITYLEKRLPNGIKVNFAEQPLSPSEQEYRNKRLREAMFQIFKGVLGREPTQDEFYGRVKIVIPKCQKRSKQTP